jgi:hypothetical protein
MKHGVKLFSVGIWLLATLLSPVVLTVAGEAIIHFKNGRALRVLDYREEGDWVYLILSEPKELGKDSAIKAARGELEKPEDLVREMGVYRDTIARLEDTNPASGDGGTVARTVSRQANGVVRKPKNVDSTSPARGYVVENRRPMSAEEMAKRRATNTEKVTNVRSTADGTATAAEIQRGNEALDAVDLTNTVAGGEMTRRYRQMKMPDYIKKRSEELAEQRQQERSARQRMTRQKAADRAADAARKAALAETSADETPPADTTPTDTPPEPEH